MENLAVSRPKFSPNFEDFTLKKHKKRPISNDFSLEIGYFGDLAGNRTRDCAVRGRRLNLLTTRPSISFAYLI